MASKELGTQMVRYAASGGILTLLYSGIYWVFAVPLALPALLANTIAFCVNLVAGWALHSRWTFRGYSLRGLWFAAFPRFFLINVAGYTLNSFWVWLIVEHLGGSVLVSILPIALITPWLMFWLNRRWIFVAPAL